MGLMSLKERNLIGAKGRAGVYELWNGDVCIYVGMCVNIVQRLAEHKDKDFDRVEFTLVRCRTGRRVIETMKIRELDPELNIHRGLALNKRYKFKTHDVDQSIVVGPYCGWPM